MRGTNNIVQNQTDLVLNDIMVKRYPLLPSDYKAFLQTYSKFSNDSDTTWFLCASDFNSKDDTTEFPWNEFELQSLEVFKDDLNQQDLIRLFWDSHLPIVLSVKNQYCFFAIGVTSTNFGNIYFGQEPEYEDVVLVAESFGVFLDQVKHNKLDREYQNLF